MKVIGQMPYKGTFTNAAGETIPYTKQLLIVEEAGQFPKLINLPGDTPDLRGKEIEVLFREYYSQGKKVYKASGYNIIQK